MRRSYYLSPATEVWFSLVAACVLAFVITGEPLAPALFIGLALVIGLTYSVTIAMATPVKAKAKEIEDATVYDEGIFLVNPNDLKELKERSCKKFPFMRFFPALVIAILLAIVIVIRPKTLDMGHIAMRGRDEKGEIRACRLHFFGIPFTPWFMKWFPWIVMPFIYLMIRYGIKMGARIIGEGGWTAIVYDKGKTIARWFSDQIGVTTGNLLTSEMAVEGLISIAEEAGYDWRNMPIAIIGPKGSVGQNVCLQLVARGAKHLWLVGRPKSEITDLDPLARCLRIRGAQVMTTTRVALALRKCHLVTSVSSNVNPLDIDPKDVLPGTFWVDVSRPRAAADYLAKYCPDTLFIEGGVVAVSEEDFIEQTFRFGFQERSLYACMAETMVRLINRCFNGAFSYENSLDKIQEVARQAKIAGMQLAGWRSFDKPVNPERIKQVATKRSK